MADADGRHLTAPGRVLRRGSAWTSTNRASVAAIRTLRALPDAPKSRGTGKQWQGGAARAPARSCSQCTGRRGKGRAVRATGRAGGAPHGYGVERLFTRIAQPPTRSSRRTTRAWSGARCALPSGGRGGGRWRAPDAPERDPGLGIVRQLAYARRQLAIAQVGERGRLEDVA